MSFLAIVEMLIHNATKASPVIVLVNFVCGYIGFLAFDKALPEFDSVETVKKIETRADDKT